MFSAVCEASIWMLIQLCSACCSPADDAAQSLAEEQSRLEADLQVTAFMQASGTIVFLLACLRRSAPSP